VGDSWLHEALCRQRPELWVTVGYKAVYRKIREQWVKVGYMKLCLDRDGIVSDSWLHEAVCRLRLDLWVIVGYLKLFLVRILNCGRELDILSCV